MHDTSIRHLLYGHRKCFVGLRLCRLRRSGL